MSELQDQKSELKFSTAETILTAAMENSPAGIIVADAENLKIRFVNRAVLEITGISGLRADVPFMEFAGLFDIRRPDGYNVPIEELPLFRVLKHRESPKNVELILRHPDGSERWVLSNAAPVFGDSGEFIAGVVVFHDITERKNSEHSLKESELRFRMLSEATFEGIVITENGKTIDCSDRFCSLLGYEREELLGHDVFKFVVPDDMNIARGTILSGSEQPYEVRVTRKDGTTVRLQARGRMIHRDGKMLRIAAVRDVTDIRTAERELRESEERFRTLSSATFEGIAITENGFIADVNDRLADILGYTVSELIGRTVSDLVVPEDRETVGKKISTSFDQPYEHRSLRKDGTIIYIEARGKTVNVGNRTVRLTAVRDITDRKRADQALAESERRYRTLFNHSPDGVLLLRGNHFVECNRQMADMFGCAAEDVVGKTPYDFSPPFQPDGTASEAAARSRIEAALAGETLTFLWKHSRRDGTLFDAEVRLKHVDLTDGRCLLAFVRDVSSRIRIENEKEILLQQNSISRERLSVLSKQLLESQESERRRIARELHDEMSQYLTAMKINIQQLIGNGSISKSAEEVHKRLADQLTLIDSVIAEVRNMALDLRPSILDDLGLIPAIRWYIDRQAGIGNLRANIESDLTAVTIPPSLESACFRVVQEAVTNILRHAAATEIRVKIELDKDKLRLTVTDNGKGFNVDEAFRNSVAGKSLGLLGMQERIELAGGTLSIESMAGKGTQVKLSVPHSNIG